MHAVQPDSAETQTLLLQAHSGDRRAFDELFGRHRDTLPGPSSFAWMEKCAGGWIPPISFRRRT